MTTAVHILASLMSLFIAVARCESAQLRGQGQVRDQSERQLAARGVKQDLPSLVTKVREAEKAGKAQEAVLAYLRASVLTWNQGEPQQSVDLSESALRASESGKIPALQVVAILRPAQAYLLVKQGQRAAALLGESAHIAKQIREPERRQLLEASLSRELGYHFLDEGETQKAIKYIPNALKIQEPWLESNQSGDGRRGAPACSAAMLTIYVSPNAKRVRSPRVFPKRHCS